MQQVTDDVCPGPGRCGQDGVQHGREREHGGRVQAERDRDGVHKFRAVHFHRGQVAGRVGKRVKDPELVTVPEQQEDRFPKGSGPGDEGLAEVPEPGGAGKGFPLRIESIPEHVGVNGDDHSPGIRSHRLVERVRQPQSVCLVTWKEFSSRIQNPDHRQDCCWSRPRAQL